MDEDALVLATSLPEEDDLIPQPLLQRLELEHELNMQRLQSEQTSRALKAECKTADRALRKEERTSQALRAECAALAHRLQAGQAQHAALAKQHDEVRKVHAVQAKKLARLSAQHKEQTGQLAAQKEMGSLVLLVQQALQALLE